MAGKGRHCRRGKRMGSLVGSCHSRPPTRGCPSRFFACWCRPIEATAMSGACPHTSPTPRQGRRACLASEEFSLVQYCTAAAACVHPTCSMPCRVRDTYGMPLIRHF